MPYEPIAVIGLTCRFPDAPDVDTLWKNLLDGKEAVRPLTAEEAERYGIDPVLFADPDYVNAGAVLDGAEAFDPEYFGYSPREAELIDPQQRLFLQEARRLMDIANLTGTDVRIGAFAGCRISTYNSLLPVMTGEEITKSDRFQQLMGNDKDYLVTRAAYKLNFTGPTVVVQSACSSSLVAVHLACDSLRSGDCDVALAGGSAISFPQGIGYFRQQGMIFSDDGHCRPFSAKGSGIVAANGVGLVALKRLADAVADGDVIHGVLLGSGICNDGAARVGYTAPGRDGQQSAIKTALERSRIAASDIGMLEAHATGTPLGDPMEVIAVAEVYANAGARIGQCAIGSLKGNIGHLDSAAGIAGLIKTVLAVRDGIIPSTLNAEPMNETIGFERTPFYPALKNVPWPESFEKRIGAVSAFGIGGTNAHIIVGEPPKRDAGTLPTPEEAEQVLVLSAHDPDVLKALSADIARSLDDIKAPSQCATLALRRAHDRYRMTAVGADAKALKEALAQSHVSSVASTPKRTAWMFSGQAGQYPGMGAELYARNPAFRAAADDCFDLFAQHGLPELKEILFDEDRGEDLNRVLYSQPGLFTWQYAVTRMLDAWGVRPDLAFGHSFGEYAAAVCAGYLSLENAVKLVSLRGLLVENKTPEGAMIAVTLNEERLKELLSDFPGVYLAACNGPDRFTLSGEIAAMDRLTEYLTAKDLDYRKLFLNRAFHTPAMERLAGDYWEIELAPDPEGARVPMLSCLTAAPIEPGSLDADYWYRHLRNPSRFFQTLPRLSDHQIERVIKIGPNGGFARLLRSLNPAFEVCAVAEESRTTHAQTIAHLYRLGYNAPVQTFYGGWERRLETMPPLRFREVRCWPKKIDAGVDALTRTSSPFETFLTPLADLVAWNDDQRDVRITFDRAVCLEDKPQPLRNERGLAGTGTVTLLTTDGVLTGRYSYRDGTSTAETSHRTGESLDIPACFDRLKSRQSRITACRLGPQWAAADSARVTDHSVILMRAGVPVAELDLQDAVAQTEAYSEDLFQWEWLPYEAGTTAGRNTGTSSCAVRRVLIVGESVFAGTLENLAKASDIEVIRSNDEDLGTFDVIIDTRAFDDETGFEKGAAVLAPALGRADRWLAYLRNHPTSTVVTLLPTSDYRTPAPSRSPFWGICTYWRTLKNEHTAVKAVCLETDTHDQSAETVLRLIRTASDHPPLMRIARGKVYEPVVRKVPLRPDPLPVAWTPGKTTLIAGFGPVGRSLALWLAGQGCRDLSLVLHRKPDHAQSEILATLESKGVTVRILEADIRNEAALRAALSQVAVPVGCAFHTAHAGKSELVGDQPPAAFMDTLSVKVEGSLALYRALASHPLEIFCLFSSAASMMAMPGAAYNVANAWQDAFAAHLRSEGVPAVSVSWGQLEMDRREDKKAQLQTAAMKPIKEARAFTILNTVIKDGTVARIPFAMDAGAFATVISGLPATRSVLRPVLEDELAAVSARGKDDVMLDAADEATRLDRIKAYLRRIVNERLKFEDDALDADRPLTQQGVDSLVFLELIHVINKQFDLSLPTATVHKHRTINALAAHIDSLIAQAGDIDFSRPLGKGEMVIESRPEERFNPFPLTDLQQAYVIGRGDALTLGNVSCHQYMEFDLPGTDPTRIEDAWNRLIDRHDMLRAVIRPEGDQCILKEVPRYALEVIDLSTVTVAERDKALAEIRERMSYQVLDPYQWPLFELRASRLPNGVLRLHLDMDLLISDVQSFRVLSRELVTLMDAPETVLPPLDLSYRDYILAEENLTSGDQWKKARAFWQNRLQAFPDAPQLPLRCDPRTVARPTFRTLSHRLDADLWTRLKTVAMEKGLTASGALLAAFSQTLALFAENPAFSLNITYFNRRAVHPRVMDICGDFTSIMLLPVSTDTGDTFLDTAAGLQKDLWDALSNRDYNGLRLMRDLGRHRGQGADRIEMPVVFTSMIGMDFSDQSSPEWKLMSKQIFQTNQTPQVWLDYQATEFGGSLNTNWFIADDLFEPALIEDVFAHYTRLLERLADDTATWALPLTSLFQPENLSSEVQNRGRDPESRGDLIAENKETFSVVGATGSATFDDLQRAATSLSGFLCDRGLGTGDKVGVVSEGSLRAVAAEWAVLRAGGCYVPLFDPESVDAGLSADTDGLFALLRDVAPSTETTIPTKQTFLDIDLHRLDFVGCDAPSKAQATVSFKAPAVQFTPKAVLNRAGFVEALERLCPLFECDDKPPTLLCFQAFSTPAAVLLRAAVRSQAGRICLSDPRRPLDARHWVDLIKDVAPSHLSVTGTLLPLLLDALSASEGPVPAPDILFLESVTISGSLVRRLGQIWPQTRLYKVNVWTTETPVLTISPIVLPEPGESVLNEVGHAGQFVECLVLDTLGRRRATNVIGEICFSRLPSADGAGQNKASAENLTRTGFLGRETVDGRIVCLGSMESPHSGPAELERALENHPGVSQAVVLDISAQRANEGVHAWYVPTGNQKALPACAATDGNLQSVLLPAQSACNQLDATFDIDRHTARFDQMERLSTLVILLTLQNSSLFRSEGDCARVEDVVRQLNALPKYETLVTAWINVMLEEGWLSRLPDGSLRAEAMPMIRDAYRQLFTALAESARNGDQNDRRTWAFFNRCIDNLPGLLSGQVNPLELMFEGGETDFVESWYADNPLARHFNAVTGRAAGCLLANRSGSEPLRILEFGAGIGGGTQEVLKNLPNDAFEYVFTEMSDFFLDKARTKFTDVPQMNFGLLDIDIDPALQGYERGCFDLIVGTNALHDARNLRRTAAMLRSLLKPDGALLFSETTETPRFTLISLNFIEAITHFEDERVEKCLPLIGSEGWRNVLKDAGYAAVDVLPEPGSPIECLKHHVFIGRNTSEAQTDCFPETDIALPPALSRSGQSVTFHRVDALPLTRLGRIDRDILLRSARPELRNTEPTESAESPEAAYAPLAAVWSALLNETVSDPDANFFVLGGDSLLMTRLAARLKSEFGVEPGLAALLRTPVLREQAALVKASVHAATSESKGITFETGTL